MKVVGFSQVMTMDGYFKLMWNDQRLKWDADQWNGIKQMTVSKEFCYKEGAVENQRPN